MKPSFFDGGDEPATDKQPSVVELTPDTEMVARIQAEYQEQGSHIHPVIRRTSIETWGMSRERAERIVRFQGLHNERKSIKVQEVHFLVLTYKLTLRLVAVCDGDDLKTLLPHLGIYPRSRDYRIGWEDIFQWKVDGA